MHTSVKLTLFFLIVNWLSANGQVAGSGDLLRLQRRLSDANQLNEDQIKQYQSKQSQPLFFTDSGGTHFLVSGIQANGQPEYRMTLNEGAARTTGASFFHTGEVTGVILNGQHMQIGVWDAGLVIDHIELQDRVIAREGLLPNGHAMHVTGTLIASGVNPLAKGMAPLARASTYYFQNDLAVMAGLAGTDQTSLLFSNHSYGTTTGWVNNNNTWYWSGNTEISTLEDYRFGFYNDRAAAEDEIAFLAPYYSIFWAAGNDRSDKGDGSRPADCNAGTGYDCIIPDGVAKNIFTIGAVDKVDNYVVPGNVVMGDYSSWGPTDDGRIKPDLVAAGTDLFSLSATGQDTYQVLGGTSMATPNAAGSLLLVQELYSRLNGGQRMKSATLKALAFIRQKKLALSQGRITVLAGVLWMLSRQHRY